MTEPKEPLTKIYVDLPRHWATGGESMWALPLGRDLFEIRNTPFYAYDLNFLDVVRAASPSPDVKPHVLEVVRRGGHRTVRVLFNERVDQIRRVQILDDLGRFGVSYEGCSPRYFALDLAPVSDMADVRAQLDALEREDILSYETNEARAAGSFDDRPDDDNGD